MATYDIDKPFSVDSYTMVLFHCEKPPSLNTDGLSVNYCIEDNTLQEDENNILFVTKFKKFGTLSVKAPSTASCLVKYGPLGTTNNTLLLNTNNWTIEMWIYRDSEAAQGIFEIENKIQVNIDNKGYLTLDDKIFNTKFKTVYTSPFKLEKSTWHHVAVVRYADELQVYADGIQAGVVFGYNGVNFAEGATYLMIGGTSSNRSPSLYFDEIRISKTNRYNAVEIFENNFSNYTNDADDLRYTKSILQFNDAKNPGKDEYDRTWFVEGLPELVTDGAKFTKALLLTRDSQLESSNGIEFGGQDFTIDFWIKLTSTTASDGTIFSATTSAGRNIGDEVKRDYIAISRSGITNYLKLQLYGSDSSSLLYTPNTYTVEHTDYTDFLRNKWKVSGDTTLTEANAKFNTSLAIIRSTQFELDGTIALGGQDFTIDFWAYISSSSPTTTPLFSLNQREGNNLGDNSKYGEIVLGKTGTNGVLIVCDSEGNDVVRENTIAVTNITNTLHHYALVYQNSAQTLKLYVDGVAVYTGENVSIERLNRYFTLGKSKNTSSNYLMGNIEEFRISDGVARWTNDFEVPTESYTEDAYTKILLHMDDKAINKTNRLETVTDKDYMDSKQFTTSVMNSLVHCAFVYQHAEQTITFYINGALQYTLNEVVIRRAKRYVTLGRGKISDNNYMIGTIDEFRISDGIARWTEKFTAPTTPYEVDENTKSLLHFNEEIEKDEINNTWILSQPTVISSENAKFSKALQLNGNGLYLKHDGAFEFGGKNFTIEGWACVNSVTNYSRIFEFSTADNNYSQLIALWRNGTTNKFQFVYYSGTTQYVVNTISDIPLGEIFHFAMVYNYNSRILMGFINGVKQGQVSMTGVRTNYASMTFGRPNISSHAYLNGTIDSVEITDGIARYSADFDVPTTPYVRKTKCTVTVNKFSYSNLNSKDFKSDYEVRALLHFDNENNPVKDEYNNTWNYAGTPIVTTTNAVSESAVYMNNSINDYKMQNLILGGKDFTIDYWVTYTNRSILESVQLYYSTPTEDNNIGLLGVQSGSKSSSITLFYYGSEDSKSNVVSIVASSPTHIALVYTHEDTTLKLYANGVLKSTATIEIPTNNYDVVFTNSKNTTYGATGTYDEFRISDGIARWNENFTPPEEEYAKDKYTKVLLHFNNKNDIFKDECDNAWETNTRLEISTSRKIGTSGLYLDGENYIYLPISEKFDLSNDVDFTIDWWEYKINENTGNSILSIEPVGGNSSNHSIILGWYEDSKYKVLMNDKAAEYELGEIKLGEWIHRAFVKSENQYLCFEDGVLVHTYDADVLPQYNSTYQIIIGKANGVYSKGYIDELRISIGVARWVDNFTPTTKSYDKDNETAALLHFDDASAPYKDVCNNPWVANLAKVATTNAKFNNALQISHTNRFVEHDGPFTIGGKDFTIDFWMFMDSSTGKNGRVFSFFYNVGSTSNRFFLSRNGENNTLIMCKNTSYSSANTSDIIGKLLHVAVVYQHAITTLSLFINGVKEVSWNCGTFSQYEYPKFAIARTEVPDTDGEFIGTIDEFRITDGIAMYINNYNPPTEPYGTKALTNPKIDEWGSDVNSVNRNDRTYYDKILDDKKYKVSTVAMRFQKKGLYAADYLVNFFRYDFIKDLKYTGSENFTAECCIYMPSTYSIVREIINLKFNSKNYLNIYLNTGNKYEISMNDEVKYTYPTIPTTKTWHHVALVRYGSDLYLYINKKKVCIIATDFDVDFTKMRNADLIIGKNYNVLYLLFDNLRVTNAARYIA